MQKPTPKPKPRPNAEIKSQSQVDFLLSKKSPLQFNQKQRIKAELRHGTIVIKKPR